MSSSYQEDVHNIQQIQEQVHVQEQQQEALPQIVKQTKLKKLKKHKHDIVKTKQEQVQEQEQEQTLKQALKTEGFEDHELFTLPTISYETLQTQTFAQETSEIVSQMHVGQINVRTELESQAKEQFTKELNALTQQQQQLFEIADKFESTLKSITEGVGQLNIAPGLKAQSSMEVMQLQSSELGTQVIRRESVQATQQIAAHDAVLYQTQTPYESVTDSQIQQANVKQTSITTDLTTMLSTNETYSEQTMESAQKLAATPIMSVLPQQTLSGAHTVSKQEKSFAYESMSELPTVGPEQQNLSAAFAPLAEKQESVLQQEATFYAGTESISPQKSTSKYLEQIAVEVATTALLEKTEQLPASDVAATQPQSQITEAAMRLATQLDTKLEDCMELIPTASLQNEFVSMQMNVNQSSNMTTLQTVYESTRGLPEDKLSATAVANEDFSLHQSIDVASLECMDNNASFEQTKTVREHASSFFASEKQHEAQNLETVAGEHAEQPQTAQAQLDILAQKETNIVETLALESMLDMPMVSSTEAQRGATNYSLQSSINVRDVQSMESADNLAIHELNAPKQAGETRTDSLVIANTSREFPINTVSPLETEKVPTMQEANYEFLPLQTISGSDVIALEANEYSRVSAAVGAVGEMDTVKNTNILEVMTTMTSEKIDNQLPGFVMPESTANETFNELSLRSAVVDKQQTEESVELLSLNKETSKHAVSKTDAHEELRSETCQTYEKETVFEELTVDNKKQATLSYRDENICISVGNENILEKEKPLSVIETKSEEAEENNAEQHKLPLVGEVQNMYTTGNVDSFSSPKEVCDINLKPFASKTVSETYAMEVSEETQHKLDVNNFLEEISANQRSVTLLNNIIQYENVATEKESILPKPAVTPLQHTQETSSDLHQQISIVEQPDAFDSTRKLPDFDIGQNVQAIEKMSEIEVRSQVVADTQSYETIAFVQHEQTSSQQANIDHQQMQISLIEEQQVAESTKSYESKAKDECVPTISISPEIQRALTIDEIKSDMALDRLDTQEPTLFEVKPQIENEHQSINVSQDIELNAIHSLVEQTSETQTAVRGMREDFQRSAIVLTTDIYNKETVDMEKPHLDKDYKSSKSTINLHELTTTETVASECVSSVPEEHTVQLTANTKMTENMKQGISLNEDVLLEKEAIMEIKDEEHFVKQTYGNILKETLVESVQICDQVGEKNEIPVEKIHIPDMPMPQKINHSAITKEQYAYENTEHLVGDKNLEMNTLIKATDTINEHAILTQKDVEYESVEKIPENITQLLTNKAKLDDAHILNTPRLEPAVAVLQKEDTVEESLIIENILNKDKTHDDDSNLALVHITDSWIDSQGKPEKSVYITTFKSVQNDAGETTIQSENKRILQEEGVFVEEVLSDTEPVEMTKKAPSSSVDIVEISEIPGEAPKIYKQYEANIIEEEPIEEAENEKEAEAPIVEEIEIAQVEVVEEEIVRPESPEEVEEESPEVTSIKKPTDTKQKLKKKKPKKTIDEHDLIIQNLLEQEIEKTELEKFDKGDFELPDKLKPEKILPQPIKIERKEQKPIQVQIVEAAEVPQAIKLKKVKRIEKPIEETPVDIKPKLKSRIVQVVYPPELIVPKFTEIGAFKQNGELSRNIEEAEERQKSKPLKMKKPKAIKTELEKVDLETYVKPEDEVVEETVQKPTKPTAKPTKPEESDVNLKLGKGKKKPEEKPETVSLKKKLPKIKPVEEESSETVQLKPIEKIEEFTQEEASVTVRESKPEDIVKQPPVEELEETEHEQVDEPEFSVSVSEQQLPEEKPHKDLKSDVKVKKKNQKEVPIAEVKTEETILEKPIEETDYDQYTITTTVTEPAEIPKEHTVKVIDIDSKEIDVEEVIEERTVTRKKKPKEVKPEQHEYIVTEPEEETPIPQDVSSDITVPIDEKLIETPELVEIEITQEEPQITEEIAEVKVTKKKKPEPKVSEEPEQEVTLKTADEKPSVDNEVKIKKKKPTKPKQTEDSAQLEVRVIESAPVVLEEPIQESIEEKVTVEVPEEAPVEQPTEYKYEVKETVPVVPEEVPEVKVSKKPKTVPQVADEPVEAEVKIELKEKEVQPTEEEELKIKKKTPKKTKPIETEAEADLQVKIIEEDAPLVELEKVDEIEFVPQPEEETQIETVEETKEKVKTVKKKSKKEKKPVEEIEIPAEIAPSVVAVTEPIEETESQVPEIVSEDQPEYKYEVTETQPERVEEIPEEITDVVITKKVKPVPQTIEEPEAQFVLKEEDVKQSVEEEVKLKKKTKKPKAAEADVQLDVKVVEEITATPEIQEVIEVSEPEVEIQPEEEKEEVKIPKRKIKKEPENVQLQVKVIEEEAPVHEEPEEVPEFEFTKKPKPTVDITDEPEVEVVLKETTQVPVAEEEVKLKKKKPKKVTQSEDEAELQIRVVEEVAPVEEVLEEEEPQVEIVLKETKEVPVVEEEVKLKKKKPKATKDQEEAELQVRVVEEVAPVEEVVEEEEPQVEIVLKETKEVPVVEEDVKIKKKKPKATKDQEEAELQVRVVEEVAPVEEVVEEEEPQVEIVLKETKEVPVVEEEVKIKKKKPKATKGQEEAELQVRVVEEVAPVEEVVVEEERPVEAKKEITKPTEETKPAEYEFNVIESQLEQETIPEVAFDIKKPEELVPDEPEVKVKLEERIETTEDKEVTIKKKPKKPTKTEEVEADVKVIQEIPSEDVEQPEEEELLEVSIKKPHKKHIEPEPEDEEIQAVISVQPTPVEKVETVDDKVKIKKKKPKNKEEAADELKLTQEVVQEVPVDVVEEVVIEEAIVRRKPKTKVQPVVEEHEEQDFTISTKKPYVVSEDVGGEASVLQKRPSKPKVYDEEAAQLSIKREEEYEEEDDVEEFVISKKPKPTPGVVREEEEQAYTVKKLKRRKKGVEIPEFTDVENVTFRPKSTKTKEDVDQEFNIALDSYAEEEISLSRKVKLKKPVKQTYSEASEEAKIKILQDVVDDEGPIIEEIRDDSSIEDTMYDVEEPEEYQVEELPPDDYDIKLKPKGVHEYSVHDEEEEQFLIGIRREKSNSVTYDEDSLTFKKKRKVIQQVYNEEGACLNITREMDVDEDKPDNAMYSICNYIADNDEAINLVEGEKVYVIGRHSSEWWYVKKSITQEEGWVPAQYLMDADEYTQYVQKKLHEKIDKLPVFERPGPNEKPMAPRFIEKLQPIHTPDGYTVQFECKVEGIPRPQIAWFRETAIIKPSQDFQMFYDDDNVATLIIREVFPEDAGKFTCVAKNACGFTSTTTELIVETPLSDHGSDGTGMSRKSMSRESSLADILEGIPPTFSRKPKAQYVDENSNVILECRLVAVPEPEILWTFNGKDITDEIKNIRIVTESDMHMYCSVLHISKVKKSQEGVYEVIATNREGESRLPITLKVRTTEQEAPQILEPLRNMVIREGESAVLSTQIVGNPAPTVLWFKDGKPVKENIKSDKDTHTLTLISPKTTQKGEYTVKATNPLGSVETSALLTIEEATSGNAEPPLFVERFEEQSVPQKGVIRLPAKVTGNPVAEVEWLFNNKPLYPNERIQQKYDGENIELIITDANADTDSGDYKCIASNPYGKTSHGARVIVEVDEVTFTKKLKRNITIEEIQSLVLECETSHVVTTKWYFNNKELSGMDHRVVVENGKIHKLVIRNTTLRDSGTYTCKIKNQETLSTVEVLPRKPEFIRPLEDSEVTEKDVAILEVEISTEASQVIWFRNGQEIPVDEPNIDQIKDGKIRKLIVRNVSIHDEGEYMCKLDDQICAAELTVIELPPEIIKPLQDVTVTKGETAEFEVELSKGDALVKWYFEQEEITMDSHVKLSIDGKKQTLRIIKAQPSDIGQYSVAVGEQSSTAKLTVEEPLIDFIVRLPEVVLAPKGTDTEFMVEVSQPDVDVVWYKKGKPVKPSAKDEVFVEGTVRRYVIHNVDDEDAGPVTCVAANVKTSSNLVVEDVQLPPTITLDREKIKVKENDDVTITVKIAGAPAPECEWSTAKNVIVKSKRLIPTSDEQFATLTIKKVQNDDEGEYTLRVKNPVGEAEASLHLIIMRKPTPPGTPQSLDISSDSLTLYWKAPENTGNTKITEYILEYQETGKQSWTEIKDIHDTTYIMRKLQIDKEYIFRAIAVNEVGPSPPSEPSSPMRLITQVIKEKPSIRQPLQDIVTEPNTQITLSCIFGGIPEPTITWKKNDKVFESTTMSYEERLVKYVIETTTEESEGIYTCVAENELGSVETSCTITLREKPSIEIDSKYLTQKLRCDATLTIPATVRGYPQPKITWFKETIEEEEISERITITTTKTTSTYVKRKLVREDTGRYRITATNESGSATTECTVNVVDKPSRPQTLEIKDVKKDAINLEWTPPADDGGLELKQYVLEKCDLQNQVWMKVADLQKDITAFAIQKLSMNAQYMFRIVAVNSIGESEPTVSETVTVAKKFEKPSPPLAPVNVSGMTENSFTLYWEPSETDGGSKIIEYIVEMREFGTKQKYKLFGQTNGNVTNILITNVVKDKAYQFRIYARNEVGTSEALETEDKILVELKITPPSPPQNLRAPNITSRSVTLDWEKPANNGGSEITGYCIEKRSTTSTTWTKVVTLDAHCLQYTVDNLKEKCEYSFRVMAENAAGFGAPAVTETISLKTHATVPSPPTAPLEARVIAANAHVFEWGLPESDGGAPLLGYHIAIRDMRKTMWIEVGRVPAGVQRFQIRDLQENHEYMIRIFAKNEVGLSEPLESDEPYKAQTKGFLNMLPDEARTELSTCNTSSWLRDHNMDADIHSYARGKLLRRDEYFFRIWAQIPKKKKNSK